MTKTKTCLKSVTLEVNNHNYQVWDTICEVSQREKCWQFCWCWITYRFYCSGSSLFAFYLHHSLNSLISFPQSKQTSLNLIHHLLKCDFSHSASKSCPVGRSSWTVLSPSCLCLNVSAAANLLWLTRLDGNFEPMPDSYSVTMQYKNSLHDFNGQLGAMLTFRTLLQRTWELSNHHPSTSSSAPAWA